MTRINAGCKIKIMLGSISGIDNDPLPEGLEVLFFLQISKINMEHNKASKRMPRSSRATV